MRARALRASVFECTIYNSALAHRKVGNFIIITPIITWCAVRRGDDMRACVRACVRFMRNIYANNVRACVSLAHAYVLGGAMLFAETARCLHIAANMYLYRISAFNIDYLFTKTKLACFTFATHKCGACVCVHVCPCVRAPTRLRGQLVFSCPLLLYFAQAQARTPQHCKKKRIDNNIEPF